MQMRDGPLYALHLLAGTFAPFRLASESPMAMACFLLLTRFPLFPLFKLPSFILCIDRFTDFLAAFPYSGMKVSFRKVGLILRIARDGIKFFPSHFCSHGAVSIRLT